MNILSASWAANLSLFCSRPPFTRCGIKLSSENVKAETDALPLCFSPAAPDTAGGPELHPEAVPGEAEVPGGPRGLPEALRPHQQPAEEDPPWGGGAGGWRGGGRRGWSRRRGRRGGRGYRRAGAAEAAVPGQDEGEGAGDGLLLSKVWPGGAAALPAGALLPVSRMPVQPGYLPGTHPQPPGPSVQPGRQRLTVWTSLCRLFTKLGDATWGHAVDRITRRRAAVNLRDMYRGCVCSSPGCRVLSPPRSEAAVDLRNLDSSSASGSTGSLMSTLCRSVTAIYNVRDLKKNKKKQTGGSFLICCWCCVSDFYCSCCSCEAWADSGIYRLQATFDAPWLAWRICADDMLLLSFHATVWFIKYSV